MKLLICALFAWLPLICLAQEPVIELSSDGRSEMSFVFAASGSQEALFSKSKDWIFRTYTSGKTAEQFDDKSTGHFLVKGKTTEIIRQGGYMDDGAFTYDLTIDVKEGKARFFINNIYYKAGATSRSLLVDSGGNLADAYPSNWPSIRKKSFQSRWQEIQLATKADLVALAKSYQAALIKKDDGF